MNIAAAIENTIVQTVGSDPEARNGQTITPAVDELDGKHTEKHAFRDARRPLKRTSTVQNANNCPAAQKKGAGA